MKKNNSKRGKRKLKTLARDENNPLVQELIDFGQGFPSFNGISRAMVPLAPSGMRVVCSYGFDLSITTTIGEMDALVFTGSGMFDPEVSGVGAQPMGFDQWSTFYGRNRVLASSIQFDVTVPDSTTSDQTILNVGILPAVGGTLPSTMAAARSMPYAKFKSITGTIPNGNRFSSSMESDLIQGIPRLALLTDDNLSGTSSSNAAELWYWMILTQPTDMAAATTIRVSGTIHYLADFFDRNLLALSSNDVPRVRKGTGISKIPAALKRR